MDKAIWITGASSGIGKAIVKLFVTSGYTVIASARREDLLIELQNELAGFAEKIKVVPCDVSSLTSIEKTYTKISLDFKVDCLINNAGITSFKPFKDNTVDEIEGIINTNLLGSIYTVKTVLPGMIKQGGGSIINMLSVITEKVFTNSSLYSASKTGLLAFTEVLREEVRKYNIRVMAVTPGATETEIWSEEMRHKFSQRMMQPSDIARIILFAYKQNGNVVLENIIARPVLGDL